MTTQENTYTFELDYDKVDYTVDTVVKQLKQWQETSGMERVSFLVTEEVMGILGLFSIKSKKMRILITGSRHAKVLCFKLGIKFKENKYKYQKDLFQLNL